MYKAMYRVSNIYETLGGLRRSRRGAQAPGAALQRLACGLLLLACSCSTSPVGSESVSAAEDEAETGDASYAELPVEEAKDTFRADNDIAMTVRSMAYAHQRGGAARFHRL